MKRSAILKKIMSKVDDDEIVIASTGYISREVYRQRDRDLNFYMMGSMGNALSIGLGLAMHLNNNVIVINGDGAALMGLGSLVTAQKYNQENLGHFILDNKCHESTGGQSTASSFVEFASIYSRTFVYETEMDNDVPPRIPLSPRDIARRFKSAVEAFGYK